MDNWLTAARCAASSTRKRAVSSEPVGEVPDNKI